MGERKRYASEAEEQRLPDSLKLDGLGNQLRNLRERLEMRGPQFAEAIGIDPSTLSKYELNRRAIPLPLIEKVAEVANQPASAVLVWFIRERFPELGTSPSEVAKFLHVALRRLETSVG